MSGTKKPKPTKEERASQDKMGGLKLDEGSYGSPRWTYEILDCSMPMTFDTYSNCAHQCLYCFSFFQRAIGDMADDYLHHRVRAVNAERVKRMFSDPNQYGGQFANYINKRMVLQWGGLSDGFDFYEKKFRVSLDLLRFFREIDYPVSISTKGVWWTQDPEYIEVVKDAKHQHWKYSIITSIEDHVKKLEPGVPPSRARFKALETLNKLGVGATTLRFRPFTPGTSDLCIDEMMQMAADAGCYSVTTEFLTWESRASNTSKDRLAAMSKVLGYDVWEFYQKNSARASGLLRLNYDLKRPYMEKMKESAEKHGLKFFVSDAHHKELSYHAGCCGLPESGPLSVTNRGQYAEAILIAKDKGFVRWSDIEDLARDGLKGIPLYQAEGFPTDSVERAKRRYQTMFDYMHDVWNTPNSWQSPNRYFGGALVASGVDDNGDIIYLYNKPFIEEGIEIKSVNSLAYQLRMVGKPNADRFDEMVADSTPFAHVAYPIYVLSSNRWGSATTMKLLDQAKLNYTLVVPRKDLKFYEDKFPNADILVVPEGVGAGNARSHIYELCKAEENSFIWMLDDDIVGLVDDQNKDVNFRQVMSFLEGFMGEYSNIAMLGVSTNPELPPVPMPAFSVNLPVRGLMLVSLLSHLGGFDDNYKVYEDLEFAIRHIKAGMVTVQHNNYTVLFGKTPGGGASSFYVKNEDAMRLHEEYPECVDKPNENVLVPIPEINWQWYTSSIMSRNVQLLMEGK